MCRMTGECWEIVVGSGSVFAVPSAFSNRQTILNV